MLTEKWVCVEKVNLRIHKRSKTWLQSSKDSQVIGLQDLETPGNTRLKMQIQIRKQKAQSNIKHFFFKKMLSDETTKRTSGLRILRSTATDGVNEEFKNKKKCPIKFLMWQVLGSCGKGRETFAKNRTMNTNI